MDADPVGVKPVDTYVGAVGFSPFGDRFVRERISSLRSSESNDSLAWRRFLASNEGRPDLSGESRELGKRRPLADALIEQTISTAAELFDAHPESLDEVFDFEFQESFVGLLDE